MIHPGDNLVVSEESDNPLPQATYDHLRADRSAVFFSGVVFYDDVFGDRHETHFRYEFSGEECFRTGKLRISKEGNDAA